MDRPLACRSTRPMHRTARPSTVPTHTRRGSSGDALAGPAPERVVAVGGRAVTGDERPEHPARRDGEQRRQQRGHGQQRAGDTDRGHRPEATVGVELGGEQAEQADDHRRARGEDRRCRLAQGERHRFVLVGVPVQLLAIAGDEEQGIVRPRTEDQHEQDARALAVDGEPGMLGEQVVHPLRQHQRHGGGDHGDDPQERTSVGRQQDDDDHDEGGVQQGAVDLLEDPQRVGRVACGTGHVDLQSSVAGRRCDQCPDGLDLVHQGVRVGAVELDGENEGLAVRGGDGRRHGTHHAGGALDLRSVAGRLRYVGSGQPGASRVDDDRGCDVGWLERILRPQHLGRLRAGGQIGRGDVLLCARQLAGERDEHHGEQDPQQQNRPFATASARQSGEPPEPGAGRFVARHSLMLPGRWPGNTGLTNSWCDRAVWTAAARRVARPFGPGQPPNAVAASAATAAGSPVTSTTAWSPRPLR